MRDATRFTLDARTMRVTFTAWLGPLRVEGHFGELHGALVLPNTDIERATLEVAVAAASIDTGMPMRDRHLRGPSFLDADRFPHITFSSRRVSRDNGDLLVAGVLALRGETREMVTRCPVHRMDGEGIAGRIAFSGALDVPSHAHGVGIARGLDLLNPIFLAVGKRVQVEARLVVPAMRLLPALLPALGH
ncbi:MAG: YceI family protein [Gemmatimonadetes bacterium]|nr:YceI family protein [Gemmatimonadota bacterium]